MQMCKCVNEKTSCASGIIQGKNAALMAAFFVVYSFISLFFLIYMRRAI